MEYHIDCAGIGCSKELHQKIAATLFFPDWYGHNLDALYDCLSEIGAPTHLILRNWDDTQSFAPGFRSAFEDAQADNPNVQISFE
jgi:ribonuclease inhibitor